MEIGLARPLLVRRYDMLRISRSTTEDPSEPTLLRLEGHITGPWVEELRRVCAETLGNNGCGGNYLVLDLAGVSFLDAGGVALFRELAARRVSFTNSSTFIAEQLKGVADVDR